MRGYRGNTLAVTVSPSEVSVMSVVYIRYLVSSVTGRRSRPMLVRLV